MRPPAISQALQSATSSPTLAMNELVQALERDGRTVYKFGFGQSPFAIPYATVLALQHHAHQRDYLPVRGLPALCEAVAIYHQRQGIPCGSQDILIGPGSKQLMFLLFLTIEAEVWIPAPSWVSYAPQARMLGRKFQWIPTRFEDGWRLRPDQLRQIPAGSILVLNYPNNPTGLTYSRMELAALAAAAREHDLIILSDEIYGELHHQGNHQSIALDCPERTFVTGGLSKWCGAGGWRIGTMRVPPEMKAVRDALSIAASETYSCAPAPMQFAAVAAYTDTTEIPIYLHESRASLRELGAQCVNILRAAGILLHDAECGFYLFPDFTPHRERLQALGITTSAAMCDRLLQETGVALLPGTAFGQPPDALQARLAYVEEPLKTLSGVQALADWVTGHYH
jgi:aspartate aminotransferase